MDDQSLAGWGFDLSGAAFRMVSDGSLVRGVVFALLTSSLTTEVGMFLARHVATLKCLQNGIREAALVASRLSLSRLLLLQIPH